MIFSLISRLIRKFSETLLVFHIRFMIMIKNYAFNFQNKYYVFLNTNVNIFFFLKPNIISFLNQIILINYRNILKEAVYKKKS